MSWRDIWNHYIKLNINAVYFLFVLFYCNDIPNLTRKGVFAEKTIIRGDALLEYKGWHIRLLAGT